MKLGKKPVVKDARTLELAKYLTGLSNPPRTAHWGHDLTLDALGNDSYGDCVEAGYAHQAQAWAARCGLSYAPRAQDVLGAYSAITGFDPLDPSTDRGTDMLSACKFWKSTGLNGIKVDAYATVDPANTFDVKVSVAEFGGCYIGLAMPLSAQAQTFNGTWEVTSGPDSRPGSWGGHCVPVTGYGPHGLFCITWGRYQVMNWDFFQTYCDEAYALLSHEWMTAAGVSPSHLAWGQLQADLANV